MDGPASRLDHHPTQEPGASDAPRSADAAPGNALTELGRTQGVWFGLYDDQLYVEHGERRYGPYAPSGGPIPLHHDRRLKRTPNSAPTALRDWRHTSHCRVPR